ncbi:MAG TPA: Fe-S oxidoreductase [Eggerthellaceae bacterium]|nr:Fe-S oxidoreductase [Eggerthellaceae bacterium]
MEPRPAYPGSDIARAAGAADVQFPRAPICAVAPDSPADDAGFEPGCFLTSVDGQPLRDIIDWRWKSSDLAIEVGYIDLDGEAGEVQLFRDPGEDWGFEFDGLVFDGVKQCRNACTFCFMRQLPRGMRSSLYLRDDDFRLSFLVGTFVTLTNLNAEDERRIVEQRISPLRVSLQASDPAVRARLIGRHAQHGIDALERLLSAGIQFHAQVVLVPGENDGDALVDTLEWAWQRPGILEVGIVPLGFTRHQDAFARSFNDASASRDVLDAVAPFQERGLRERQRPWVHAADEFYRNAWPQDLLQHVPPAPFYGDFGMFEDGIGIIRSTVDDWRRASRSGAIRACAAALRSSATVAYLVSGLAQREYLDALVEESGIADCFRPLYVRNDYFGGNVDVTGLLTGTDIARAVRRTVEGARHEALFAVLRVVFNDDGLTLDDMLLEDVERAAGHPLRVVSCSPLEYFDDIAALVRA